MKKINNYIAFIAMLCITNIAQAQTNIFPATGNVGIGTIKPTKNLQVMGTTQLGSKKNALNVSAAGKLSFLGTGAYMVDSGQYVFRNSSNSNYGLFFGQPTLRYEFRDQNSVATFFVNANNGNGYFAGNLGVGILNPVSKLDVNGDINISIQSTLKMNGKNVFNSAINGNLFVGESVGFNNTSGNNNTINGYRAFYSNTTGSWNTANGYLALYNNTTGDANIANGYYSLYNNTTGESNIAIGIAALYSNTTGVQNEATGYQSLYYNTSGSSNAAYGVLALNANIVGSYNTATGNYALYSNKTGEGNVASGYRAQYYNNSGKYNTAIGTEAILNNSTGSYNTALGAYTSINNIGISNSTVIGYTAYSSASNQVRIGNSSVTSIGGYANWTNISDGRVKKNIKENVPGLDFINKLNPVTYNLDLNEADKILQRPVVKDSTGNTAKPSQEEMVSREAKMQVLYTGFIA
ncbi:MAG: tail fiber domain-containing protein, partial [Chitinophagaceae bacterium]